jgi:hypothetical protein
LPGAGSGVGFIATYRPVIAPMTREIAVKMPASELQNPPFFMAGLSSLSGESKIFRLLCTRCKFLQ